jgi:hypothetical protein
MLFGGRQRNSATVAGRAGRSSEFQGGVEDRRLANSWPLNVELSQTAAVFLQ